MNWLEVSMDGIQRFDSASLSTDSSAEMQALARAIKTYPNDPMVKYVHSPISRHPIKLV